MSKQRLFVIAIAVVLLANLSILAKVMYNRATIISSIELSEREFSNIRYNKDLFDYGLYLDWNTTSDSFRTLNSNEQAIKQLGFSENCHAGKEKKSAFVLMQLNGQAFQNHAALNIQRLEQNKAKKTSETGRYFDEEISAWQNKKTRLYAIAVHSDAQHLQALSRNPKQEFVLKANISANCKNKLIHIHSIHPRKLTLSKKFANKLSAEKFKLVMHIGALGDAWIQSIETAPQL